MLNLNRQTLSIALALTLALAGLAVGFSVVSSRTQDALDCAARSGYPGDRDMIAACLEYNSRSH